MPQTPTWSELRREAKADHEHELVHLQSFRTREELADHLRDHYPRPAQRRVDIDARTPLGRRLAETPELEAVAKHNAGPPPSPFPLPDLDERSFRQLALAHASWHFRMGMRDRWREEYDPIGLKHE